MPRKCKITRRLENAAGVYVPNHFLLSLDAGTPFILPDGAGIDQEHVHVFLHEYWHYWHNVSTVSGFKAFAFTQHLLAHFGETLRSRADGTSDGGRSRSSKALEDMEVLLVLQHDLDGDAVPDDAFLDDWDVEFVVDDVREIPAEEVYQGRRAPNPLVEVAVRCSWPDGSQRQETLLLGACAIEESVAYLVEEQARVSLTSAPLDPPPVFPYAVVPRVVEHIVGAKPSSDLAASLGTLSLLATHPGPALVALTKIYRGELDRGQSEADALAAVVARQRAAMEGPLSSILRDDLPELQSMHAGRGLMQGALAHLGSVFTKALHRRLEDPLFDVRLVYPRLTAPALMAFHQQYPPCDLLQEREGDEEDVARDELYSFDDTPPDENGHRPTDFTRSLQAQQDFVLAHLHHSGSGFVASESAAPARCPFFGACDLEFRKTRSEVCRERPWESYSGPGDGCWYSTAVAATLGTVVIRKRAKRG